MDIALLITGKYTFDAPRWEGIMSLSHFHFVIWPERMMSGTFHPFKVFALGSSHHASPCSAGTLYPHIRKCWCIAGRIHTHCTFAGRIAIVHPPTPGKIMHMSVLTNSNKTRRICLFVAYRAGHAKLQIPFEIKILSYIEDFSAFHIGTNMHIRERDHRNIPAIGCPRHVEAVNAQISSQSTIYDFFPFPSNNSGPER